MNELFFELIQIALGNRSCLSHTPSENEWKCMYKMAKKHALIGICFVALQRLGADTYGSFTHIGISEPLYLKWLGMTAKIQRRNEIVDGHCVELQQMIADKGLRCCIFKGQTNTVLYPYLSDLNTNLGVLRQSGDIDIWMEGGRKRVIESVRKIAETEEIRETHVHLKVFKDTVVEVHYHPGLIRHFVKNARLERYFSESTDSCFSNRIFLNNSKQICAPTLEFNLVHQLTHIFHHLFTEGVGLRQVMDYYFVLLNSKGKKEVLVSRVQEMIKVLELERFASALIWVMGFAFYGKGNELSSLSFELLGVEPNEKDGRFLLDEIMQSGNFGHDDDRYNFKDMNAMQSFCRITKKNISYLRFAPFDWFWGPLWRIYHFAVRKVYGLFKC